MIKNPTKYLNGLGMSFDDIVYNCKIQECTIQEYADDVEKSLEKFTEEGVPRRIARKLILNY